MKIHFLSLELYLVLNALSVCFNPALRRKKQGKVWLNSKTFKPYTNIRILYLDQKTVLMNRNLDFNVLLWEAMWSSNERK